MMSDGELLHSGNIFTRGCRTRASLPAGHSSYQTRDRSTGVLYLQYGDEKKQVKMPSEIISWDMLWALFASAFPHQLTIKMLQSPNMAVCIKDYNRNVYCNLNDARKITPYSSLKAYQKDPACVFNHHGTSDSRISKDILSPVHSLSSSGHIPQHSLQGSVSTPRVTPPFSSSRIACSEGGTRGDNRVVEPGSPTLPSEHLPGFGRSRASRTSTNSIRQRKDVKPEADTGSTTMMLHGDGGPRYSEWNVGASHVRISSSRCSAPPILTSDVSISGVPGIPRGLKQYKVSIKPLVGHGKGTERQTQSLHRRKSMKHEDAELLGITSSSLSPHRVSEIRKFDGQMIGGAGPLSPERMTPIRCYPRQDSNVFQMENTNRSRGSRSSSSSSSVFMDGPLVQPETQVLTQMTGSIIQSERMNAMEEQIASLAGLVHHALSEKSHILQDKLRHPSENNQLEAETQKPTALVGSSSPTPPAPPSDRELWQSLVTAKRNVFELRLQLSQLKCLQLSNLDNISSMLRMVSQELMMQIREKLADSEEAAYIQRAEMEQNRIHYLATEERFLSQLSELEDQMECLQSSASSPMRRASVTLKDVEEVEVLLQQVGQNLAVLKGEFPVLQANMCSVLRTEVEAMRFLKEEPHKMDSMSQRVKVLSDVLSFLRGSLLESVPSARSAEADPLKVLDQEPSNPQSLFSFPKLQSLHSVRALLPTVAQSVGQAGAAASVVQPCLDQLSPPPTSAHGQDSLTMAEATPKQTQDGRSDVDISDANWNHSTTNAATQLPLRTSTGHIQLLQVDQTMKTIIPESDVKESFCHSTSRWTRSEQNAPLGVPEPEKEQLSHIQEDKTLQPRDDVKSSQRSKSDTACLVTSSPEHGRQTRVEKTHSSSENSDSGLSRDTSPACSTRLQDIMSDVIPPSHKDPAGAAVSTEKFGRTRPHGKVTKDAKEKERSPPAQVASRNSTQGPTIKPVTAGELQDLHGDGISGSLDVKKDVEEREAEQGPSLVCKTQEKQEMSSLVASEAFPHPSELLNMQETMVPTGSASQQQQVLYVNNRCQTVKINVDQSPSPTTAEKNDIVVLQNEPNQGTVAVREQTFKKFGKKSPAEKSSPGELAHKQGKSKSWTIRPSHVVQQDETLSSSEDHETSFPPSSLSPQNREQQIREETVPMFRDQALISEEGGSFSHNIWDIEEPPPPPLTHRLVMTNIWSKSNMDDPHNRQNSKCENGALVNMGHENYGFEDRDESDSEPTMAFFNMPVDPPSPYTPLSTIFEYEEDLEVTLCRDGFLKESQFEEEQRADPDLGLRLADISGNGSNFPQHSELCVSHPQNQGQAHTNCSAKTEAKSKFKFKFPKLSALSQAIGMGTKTAEADKEKKVASECRSVVETKTQIKECMTSEVNGSKELSVSRSNSCSKDTPTDARMSESHARVEALCKNAFKSISSLEESIKQLEISMDNMAAPSSPLPTVASPSQDQRFSFDSTDRHTPKGKSKLEEERRHATQTSEDPNPAERKRARSQPSHNSGRVVTKRQAF
ncbi:sickle tail protein homolog isoform X2 [Nothobranchius furzeri]|uniref:Transcript variant X2 n=1 Tax=Nothobranchius furzeri TaxID=105023 RepID=A0A9D2YM39_NOTFU|nr:sickle tail protein homolog isoform X2 [Nothobranchius furzeri]KAF7223092.1 transcript variant X2 [Nothobranchius furzeri]